VILAGDIGGTKTVLALFEEKGDGIHRLRDATYGSKDYPSFDDVLSRFLKKQTGQSLGAACFGVAGPVIEGKCQTTNLPWVLEENALGRIIGAPQVKLLNDLEAAAYGMLYLQSGELSVLSPGVRPKRKGNIAVIAAGTGLGEAILYWDGRRYHPVASEGGHTDFAPRTDREIEMLRYLRPKFGGHVSYERVLSGPGLYGIYSFLRDAGYASEPGWLANKIKTGDPGAVISQSALAAESPLCVEALGLFCSIYGAEAGNLALKCMAVGGVFVGGGIAPKILPALQQGGFMRGFSDKGRYSKLMNEMKVSVSLNPRAPLLGAAHFAKEL
jgi:glucokinase